MIIEFRYAIKQKVTVKAIGMPGRIEALLHEPENNMYRVAYWNNGDRFQQWLHEYEIEAE